MNHVRIYGDPFGEDLAASLLRSFLRFSLGSGMRCTLSLAGVQPRPCAPDERPVPLTDGVRNLQVGTRLPPAEVELLLRAAGEVVAATAPVLVFATPEQVDSARLLAGLHWPRASAVLVARDGSTAGELLERVRAELRWAGTENPPHAQEERELAPWLALPALPSHGPIVHVGCGGVTGGTDLVVQAWLRHFAPTGQALRIVLPSDAAANGLVETLQQHAAACRTAELSLVRSAFEPCHARDAVAIVLPWRGLVSGRVLVQALASARPVCVARFAATAPIVGQVGVCVPIGGRNVAAEASQPAHFEPHPRAVAAAIKQAIGDGAGSAGVGCRARQHVVEDLTLGRPCAPPPPVHSPRRSRPTVVLEAPFFETSSSAELSIASAQALLRRDSVDLQLVPSGPMRGGLEALRQRAPELVPLLTREPGLVDLWLASGWPVRATRPACRTLALRVDWEYGALPLDLTPHVTQGADLVVVHSEAVQQAVTAAGRPLAGIRCIPHGVDAAMHELAPPDPAIVQWKQGRPAVLFCGGLIWRKGFDVFLRAVLAARAAGADFCVVVKSVGHDQHYGRYHLGELLDRFTRTPGTPPVLRIDRELSRGELASVYTACDLLLHPYRGEGFCLPVLEARAAGLPVLATAGGATDRLMEGPGATKIPAVRREVELPGAHVSTPWLLEPSGDEAGRLLLAALREHRERRVAARAAARAVAAAYTWDAAAASLEQMAFEALGRRQVVVPRPMGDPVGEPVVDLPVTRRVRPTEVMPGRH